MKRLQRMPWQFYVSLLSIVLYSNWILGIFINWHFTVSGASISELSIHGQPMARLFRTMDFVSGLMLIVVARWLSRFFTATWLRRSFIISTLVVGIGTLYDALTPLDCSGTLNTACGGKELTLNPATQNGQHILESLIVTIAMVAMVGLVWYGAKIAGNLSALRRLSLLMMSVLIVWGFDTLIRISREEEGYGYAQRYVLFMFGVWFIVFVCIRVQQSIKHKNYAKTLV